MTKPNFLYYANLKEVKISNSLTAYFLAAYLFFIVFPVSGFAFSRNQAVEHRERGLQAQRRGDNDTALSYYQKAVQIDPLYAVAYNDVGVICEAKGFFDLAEQNYLRAIELDPNYLPSYYNIAALYEKKDKPLLAVYYWKKRIEKGIRKERWTEKAKENLHRLAQKYPDANIEWKNVEAAELAEQVADKRKQELEERVAAAHQHLKEGKKFYQEKRYIRAVEEFEAALKLTPDVPEIVRAHQDTIKALIDEKLREHFEFGRKYYELGDFPAARAEFNKLLLLTPEESNQPSK